MRSHVLAIISAVAVTSAFAQLAPSEKTLQEDVPRTGSLIRRDIAWSTEIPINRKYAELTEPERAVLRSQYEPMAPGDEPPFPAEGLKPIMKALHDAAQKLRAEGELRLVVTVGPDGRPRDVAAYESPGPQMTKFAAYVFMLTRYKPAMCSGKPCTMQYPFHIRFNLEL